MRVCTFEYVILVPFKLPIILSTSQLNQTNLPNEALDFCRGGCRAIVDSSSSHFTVPSEVAKGRVETPPQQKTLELKPGTSGNPKSNGEQYLDIFFLQTNACRATRKVEAVWQETDESFVSLSLWHPSPLQKLRTPSATLSTMQCPLPNNSDTSIGSRSAAHSATVEACHQLKGSTCMVQHHPLHHGSGAKLESKHQRGDISGDRWKKSQFVKRIVLKADQSDLDLGKMCDTDEIRFPRQVYQRVEKQVLPTMQKKLAVTAAKGWLSERFGCKLPCLGMFGVV